MAGRQLTDQPGSRERGNAGTRCQEPLLSVEDLVIHFHLYEGLARVINGVSLTIRDSKNRYLQDDGTVDNAYNALHVTPDVVGAISTTWSKEITVPFEDTWKAQARSTDRARAQIRIGHDIHRYIG